MQYERLLPEEGGLEDRKHLGGVKGLLRLLPDFPLRSSVASENCMCAAGEPGTRSRPLRAASLLQEQTKHQGISGRVVPHRS
jgi:hypothetical protein